jgi:putative PIN family toxin of toxin-antitoxin system
MKLVLDTNVLIAAFVSRGVCAEVFEHCIRQHALFSSQYILDEFRDTLTGKFKISRSDATEAKRLLQLRMTLVQPTPLPQGACRDPQDIPILGTAVAASCQGLITGDRDLLELNEYEGIKILPPNAFWKLESRS